MTYAAKTTCRPAPGQPTSAERDAMLAAISAAWSEAWTPPDLRAACLDIAERHKGRVDELRGLILLTVGVWIREGERAGLDRYALEQVVAAEMQRSCAMMMRAARERRGEPYVPARQAIVAYHIADSVAGADAFRCDIDGAVDAWDDARETDEEDA